MRHSMRYGGSVGLALVVILLFLLTSAGTNSSELAPYYPLLLLANAFVVVVLLILVVSFISRLRKRLRQRQFGSRMLTRLVLIISSVTLIPCVLIYATSTHLISQAFDSGVDSRVETALDSGVAVSRTVLERLEKEQSATAKMVADRLSETSFAQLNSELNRLRNLTGLQELRLIDISGQVVATSPAWDENHLSGTLPNIQELLQTQQRGHWSALEGDPLEADMMSNSLRIRTLTALTNIPTQQAMILQVVQDVPKHIADDINATIRGLRDYQQIIVVRGGLQTLYNWSLVLTLTLAGLCAILAAFTYASRITAPIRQLAEGTRKATSGNLQPIKEFTGADEINELTTAFNVMIHEVNEAWSKLESRQQRLEQSKSFLERILENLSSGVIVLDCETRIRTANFGAVKILGNNVLQYGVSIREAYAELADIILPMLSSNSHTVNQEDVTLTVSGKKDPLTLMVRCSSVPLDDGPGYLVVIDDMTQAVAAQRVIAWGEVARRLAHEIKNPLTPIQLAAERMEMKLEKHLPEDDRHLLHRYTHTIVEQVAAMKQMVNDFRDYAKLPKPRLKPLDLNALLDEATLLYRQNDYRITLDLCPNLPLIEADRAQLLQVIHNILSNAREAKLPDRDCCVSISTESIIEHHETHIRLTIKDNGVGFPAKILENAFEPYITTKETGTGLGLPMVKKIIDEHGGRVELANQESFLDLEESAGAIVTITFTKLS
ncbi:MAG: HAMP domain-containing protein [Burkholderiaceae bacterium]|nr:HAMP domain-containing protein [Burkholderiaceae bacterium]